MIKPVVSAGAVHTYRVGLEEAAEIIDRLEGDGIHPMVQPFMDEILEMGEWSFIYLGGAFSHAVRKRAAPGDYRVQEIHGGTTVAEDPPAAFLEQATGMLDFAAPDATYARVDCVEVDGRLLLIELELIEPTLYLAFSKGSHERLADAILR